MGSKRRRKRRESPEDEAPKVALTPEMVETIESWAEEAAEAYGLWLFDVDVTKHWLIRVYVDRPEVTSPGEGVVVQQCVDVSRYTEGLLDASEEVPERYTIEVSSPGIERKITKAKQLPMVVGRTIRVVTRDPIDGQNVYEGTLLEVDNDVLSIETGDEPIKIAWGDIAKAKLTYDF